MKRVLIGGFLHESNTFNPVPTGIEHFRRHELLYGDEILRKRRNTASESGGFIDAFEAGGIEMIPSVLASAMPGGRVSNGVFASLRDVIFDSLQQYQVDGIAFALHGAMSAEGIDDADGQIIERIRSIVGEKMPIAITLDLHANLTKAFTLADAAVVYKTYPHLDQRECGREAAGILVRLMKEKIRTVTEISTCPLMIGPPHNVLPENSPMRDIFEKAREIEKTNVHVFAACPVHGFMQQDAPFGGAGTIVTADNREIASHSAKYLSEMFFEHRHDFWDQIPDASEAVRMAKMSNNPPVAIADSGDNIGAGTPGDGTLLLHEILRQGIDSAFITLCDPESAIAAVRAGAGKTIRISVGGKSDPVYGPPAEVTGTVRTIFDGKFRNHAGGGYQEGLDDDMGLTVRIDTGGITLLLTSYPVSPNNIMHANAAGVFPEDYRISVCKGGLAFRAAYKPPIVNHHIVADTPGYSTANLSSLSFKKLKRPIYPLDNI